MIILVSHPPSLLSAPSAVQSKTTWLYPRYSPYLVCLADCREIRSPKLSEGSSGRECLLGFALTTKPRQRVVTIATLVLGKVTVLQFVHKSAHCFQEALKGY